MSHRSTLPSRAGSSELPAPPAPSASDLGEGDGRPPFSTRSTLWELGRPHAAHEPEGIRHLSVLGRRTSGDDQRAHGIASGGTFFANMPRQSPLHGVPAMVVRRPAGSAARRCSGRCGPLPVPTMPGLFGGRGQTPSASWWSARRSPQTCHTHRRRSDFGVCWSPEVGHCWQKRCIALSRWQCLVIGFAAATAHRTLRLSCSSRLAFIWFPRWAAGWLSKKA